VLTAWRWYAVWLRRRELFLLKSPKVTMNQYSPVSGIIGKLHVGNGQASQLAAPKRTEEADEQDCPVADALEHIIQRFDQGADDGVSCPCLWACEMLAR
jgi:hypothetical protein